VRSARCAGGLNDGGGVFLQVTATGASWVFRYTAPTGRRRELGLGVAHRTRLAHAAQGLTAARAEAHKARELLRQGIDTIEARERQREAARATEEAKKAERAREHWTLARASRDYHERIIEPNRTGKHGAQWIASLENHMPPALWHAPIDSIEPPALLAALLEVKPRERARRHKGDTVPETVQRIRQRLDAIFEDAIFHRRCASNPAAGIKPKMREARGRRERGEFRALPYREAPALLAVLRAAEGTAARCLEFAVLTAARASEALYAEWNEFDFEARTWQVPKERMKAKEGHTVYLPQRALDILLMMKGADARYAFPSPMKPGAPLSNMAMLTTLDRLGVRERTTVHGLARATFSTWANETSAARPDVIEACLAHEEGNRVRAAHDGPARAWHWRCERHHARGIWAAESRGSRGRPGRRSHRVGEGLIAPRAGGLEQRNAALYTPPP
jgi:integrase